MDINKLENLNQGQIIDFFQSKNKPKGDLDVNLICTENNEALNYEDFFALKYSKVNNLYEFPNAKTLRFMHESDNVIIKREMNLMGWKFDVEFSDIPIFKLGINYLGHVNIKFEEEENSIKIFGEGSYDPGSKEKYLSKYDYSVINGFFVTALHSAKMHASKSDIRKLFSIVSCHPVCKKHKLMMKYIKSQIKAISFKSGEVKDYGTFLVEWAHKKREIMKNKEYEDLLIYVYLIEKFLNEPQINVIPHTGIRPTKEYIKGFFKDNEEYVDIRSLIETTKKYEQDYKDIIIEKLGEESQNIADPSIRHSASDHYNCKFF
ncbi:hypothetical protein SteCoe_9058 [Stentor coeruleus]|uniref:Uncharacterized protein n=1 Tax=Stentor coeruleus TaxID=5963 RepID=A0A1R2CIK4_9CILI|nr:hypothetical protein SteCoe_9058 [Stentor coeruleus]